MAAATSIPGWTDALKAALAASDALVRVTVSDGPPPPQTQGAREFVYFGRCEFGQEARGIDRTTQPRREKFQQTMGISVVVKTKADNATATTRAFEIFEAIEAIFRLDPQLSAWYPAGAEAKIVSTQVEGGYLERRWTDQARESVIEFTLKVDAVI